MGPAPACFWKVVLDRFLRPPGTPFVHGRQTGHDQNMAYGGLGHRRCDGASTDVISSGVQRETEAVFWKTDAGRQRCIQRMVGRRGCHDIIHRQEDVGSPFFSIHGRQAHNQIARKTSSYPWHQGPAWQQIEQQIEHPRRPQAVNDKSTSSRCLTSRNTPSTRRQAHRPWPTVDPAGPSVTQRLP